MTDDMMNARVTRLEEWAQQTTATFARIEKKLERLDSVPSRSDLYLGFATVFAIVALVFAGMSWLDGRRSASPVAAQQQAVTPAPAPMPTIIIQTPPVTPAPSR